MIERLLSLTDVAAIAHRGGARLRPENTLAAFDHALALGVDALECDVHLSRDGEPVVIHDPTLDRTTDASGPVAARTAAELAEIDAGYRFSPAADGFPFRGRRLGIPRLAELLERYPRLPVIVEIKGDRPEVAERTVAVIREARAADRVVIGGFSGVVLETVRRVAPEIPTSASGDEVREGIRRAAALEPVPAGSFRLYQAPFRFHGQQTFDAPFVRAARAAGFPVQAWIIDEPDEMKQLIGWGVTGIISDRPDVAVAVAQSLGLRP